MTNQQNKNPWKGLDSYQENDRIYGRDEEIELLFSRIEYNLQTVVYSRSGIGKSSIINAGIFPKARKAGMLPVSVRLQHSMQQNHASAPYIEQIKQAVEAELKSHDGKSVEVVPHKEGHEETLWEYLHRFTFWTGSERVTPLLVFDQFEEIFTLERDHHRVTEFFSQVADLLNGVMPDYLSNDYQAEQNSDEDSNGKENIFRGIRKKIRNDSPEYLQEDLFHIVFALREDYLSYLERNTTNIPSLKLNRYCLLPINEEQAATIIMEPQPGLVDIEVVTLIIRKITGEKDFILDGRPSIFVDSAILSLYLNRLYEKIPPGENRITAELVNKFSNNIIQDFYLESIKDIRPSSVEYLEDNLLNNEGRRENISVYNAQHIGGLSDEELNFLSDEKKIIRRFAYAGNMRIEYIHDILCPVIKDRRDIRMMLKAQNEERKKILEKERRKRQQLEEKARADRRRYHQYLILGCSLMAIIACSWIYRQYMNVWPCIEYYENFIQVNGWPVGVGRQLSEHEALSRSISFKLIKSGHRSGTPFRMVEVMSPDGELLHNNRAIQLASFDENRDDKARHFGELMNNTKYYRFSSTQTSDTAQVTKFEALDKDQRILYVVNYFNSTEEHSSNGEAIGDVVSSYVWAVYTDAKGAPLQVRNNGADRMQVFLNEKGMEEKYMFFDENGAPKQNGMSYYGMRVHYDHLNRIDSVWALDPFSEEQFIEVYLFGETDDVSYYMDLDGKPVNHHRLGYHKRIATKDAKGNVIHKEYFDADGGYVKDNIRSAIVDLQYDNLNRMIETDDYDGNRQPYTQNAHYYPHREFQYIGRTLERLSEHDYRWDVNQKKMVEVRVYQVNLFGSVTEYTTHDKEKGIYRMKRVESNEEYEPVSISYYGEDDKPIFDSIDNFSKHIIERRRLPEGQRIVVHRYYDTDGSLYSQKGHRDYAIDSCVYNRRNLPLTRVCYDRDTVVIMSQGYEYKDGIEVARFARGIHGTPIRCPHWERDGLSYYILQSVRSMADALSYVKPVNEYGCTSWAYDGNDPSGFMEHRGQQIVTDEMGSNWKKETLTIVYADHIPSDAKVVVYVHLLRPDGVADRIGLRDGDLLLEAGNWKYNVNGTGNEVYRLWENIGNTQATHIKVGRYDQKNHLWKKLTFDIPASKDRFGCEIYPIYYTNEEFSIFKKLLEDE